MSESVNPYLDPRGPRVAYLTSPAGRMDVEVTGAGVEMAVSAELPEAAREAVRALGPAPRRPRGLTAVEGEAAWEGDVVADWDQAAQEVTWSVVGQPARSSSLESFAQDLEMAWADHAASLAAAAPLVERLRGLAPGGLDGEEAVVTWDPQEGLARMDVDMAAVPGRGGEAPGVRMSVTAGEDPDEDVVVRIEGDGHPEGTTMTPDQARDVVAQAVRDAASTPADVAWQALGPAVETLASLPGMDDVAVEDPVLLEDGSLSVQLHPDWDGPSTETSVTLTAPADGGPVTVRAGGPATQDLLTGRATPHQLAEGAWLTGVSPDLAAQPDPTRLSDAQAAALVLGAPQTSLTQAVDTLSAGLADARQAAWDAAQGNRPLATQRLRAQQDRAQARSQDQAGVRVYTTPGCMGCEMTRRQLDRAGVSYQAVDLSTRPDLASRMREQGLTRAPVVESPDGRRTSGFDPDRIRAVVAMASSPTPPTAPAPAPSPGSDEAQRPGRSSAAAEQVSRSRGAGL